MKPAIFLLALSAAAITSCTSAYKTGQTPDDVYFSPQRPQSEYVAVNNKDDDEYYTGDDYYSDRQLRMKVQNRNQWSNLDEWYYNTDRYSYSYYDGFYGNNPWTANSFWNYNYNPYYSMYFNPFYSSYNFYNPYYYSPVIIGGGKNINYVASYNRPRMFNLNTYNKQLSTNNYVTRGIDLNSAPAARNTNRYNNNYNNSRSNAGDYLRNNFNNNSTNNNSRPAAVNTNTNSSSGRSSSGSSSGSSGGGSAPVRRF